MKKTLTILAVLAVLSAGAIAVCHGWVNAARERHDGLRSGDCPQRAVLAVF